MYAKIPKLNLKISLARKFGWRINRHFKYFGVLSID